MSHRTKMWNALRDAATTEPAMREKTDEWINEDELPDGYPYNKMYPLSKLGHDGRGGVRLFPKVQPTPPTPEKRKRPTDNQVDMLLDVLEEYTNDRGRFDNRELPRYVVKLWVDGFDLGEYIREKEINL